MGQKYINPHESDYLLDYEELIAITPKLKDVLSKEEAFEFSKQLYEFTKIIFDQYKNEKEKLNT